MKVRLQATAATLTADEIRAAVPPEVMAEIKEKDSAPLLQAYSIAQEGMSKPKILGKETAPIRWTRKAIKSVGTAITKGLQFFKGHNKDNSTDDRPSLGEVVGKITKEIGGRLRQIVIGYFPDKDATADCDVCSIEADVVLQSDDSNNLVAQAISKLTGIALANSEDEIPAFPGAMRVGKIQAFEDPEDDPSKQKNKKGKETPMTFEEVKKYIIEHNVWPNQLFTEEVMKNDRVFGTLYSDKDALQKSFDELKNTNDTLKEESEKFQKEVKKKGASDRLKNVYPEGITDKQKKYLEKQFDPDKIEDLSDDGLKKFVDAGLETFKEMAAIFGDDKKKTSTNTDDGKKKEDGKTPEDDEDLDDVEKVVNNIAKDDD